ADRRISAANVDILMLLGFEQEISGVVVVLPLLISSTSKQKVSNSGKELSKVLVSSKRELREVEEDLVLQSEDKSGLVFNASILEIRRLTFNNFSRRTSYLIVKRMSSSIPPTSGKLLLVKRSSNEQQGRKELTHIGAQTRKQGDKTENKDKGKSPVVTITGFKDLNAEFKECTNNSSNGVNAASSLVSTAGHNFINSTNVFSTAGPSNAAASPTAANSLDMPNLENLTYSNDADDVGAEAGINNLESIISTKSMARAVRDQECSSCGTLYTRDCGCSKGNVEDKILVPKPPKNYARCTRCGYLVDGPNCQGCALFRQELKDNLVTHSTDFQNSSEPSNASTNVFNAPREPYVVKQDHGSFVDKIIFDLNRAPYSPNQFHCFHCKDVLRDGEACKRCTCAKCGSGLGKGLYYICGHNQNSLNDSPSISETSSQSPPNINHCCYACGDLLYGIFYKRCTCKSCGKDAHIGYNCPSKVPVISNPEPCNNQTIDELPQTLPIFHPTFQSEAESPFTLDSTPTYVDESPNVFNPPP
nr:hypothetical protein [Tanacetum cinerariifolium]